MILNRHHKSGKTRYWTAAEDDILSKAVAELNGKNWKLIAKYLPGKTEVQCLHRWTKVLNPNLTKGPWTEEVRYFFIIFSF